MLPGWLKDFIGVPFVWGGRDRTGWDCWGCTRTVLSEQRGICLPSYSESHVTPDDRKEIAAMVCKQVEQDFFPIQEGHVQPYDGIVFNFLGQPIHCGIVVAPGFFLHAMKGIGTCVERWDAMQWRKRIHGFVRWSHE